MEILQEISKLFGAYLRKYCEEYPNFSWEEILKVVRIFLKNC